MSFINKLAEDAGDFIGWGSARRQRNFEAEQAKIARDWSEQMSNTAHQREVEDLKAAGLNPVLAAGNYGASTPSATSAHGSMSTGNSGPALINAVANLTNTFRKSPQKDESNAFRTALNLLKYVVK